MLVSWWLVNSGNFDRRYFFKVLCKPANECKLLVHLHPFASTKFKFDSVCMSFNCMLFNHIQPYSFSVFSVSMHSQAPVVATKGPGKGPSKGPPKGKGKSPAAEQAKPKLFGFWCVFFIFRERCWNSAASTCIHYWVSNMTLTCSVHDLVMTL